MSRSRKRRPGPDRASDSFERLLAGWKRTETRRGQEWVVQPVSALQAQKEYICPGCRGVVTPGTAHVVAWRSDGVLGDAADLAARRHWHNRCWEIG